MVWTSLNHNGIAIPQTIQYTDYIKVYYKNKLININNTLATALYLYKKQKNIDYTFKHNFMKSIQSFLPAFINIKSISDLKIISIIIKNTETNTNFDKFKYCFVNGKKEKVDRYCSEPACIFVGRGKHRLRGSFKPSIKESDITLNISKGYKPNGNWKSIVNNKNVDWIASWNDPVLNKIKYVYPSSTSKLKCADTVDKFNFARKVKKKLSYIRKKYVSDLTSTNQKIVQHAIACYLIDSQCIRCGTDDENNTFGCTSLQKKHLTIKHNKIKLSFLGKDSILFDKTFRCKYPIIIRYLQENMRKKSTSDDIFHLISSTSLNMYLNMIIKDLTAKVFRTCHASSLYDKLLHNSTTIEEFKEANFKVATLCNHTNLQTSKANYLDPRITFSFSKRNNINIDKLYSKQLLEKFQWAKNEICDFRF